MQHLRQQLSIKLQPLTVTIIFLADNGEPVNLRLSKNPELNSTHNYGTWDHATNNIELNEKGWQMFELYRKEIRKLKPMLAQLEKSNT